MEFCKSLVADIPFAIHLVRDDPSRMVGKEAEEFLKIFWERIFRNPPCITVVGGTPGSGKSFCLANLSKHIYDDPSLGWTMTLRLTESHFGAEDLLRKIEKATGMKADKLGNTLERDKKVLCLLIDNVDEYIRYQCAVDENISQSQIFLNILRVISAMEQALHQRFCAVLSITDNIIDTLHLKLQNDPENAIMSLPFGDRNIRDRYRPVLDPKKEEGELILFKEITKDNAAEMINDCMDAWKRRHIEIWPQPQQIPAECKYIAINGNQQIIYPFTNGALDVIYETAAHIPGEVVLGAISSIQQLYEITKIRSQGGTTAKQQIINESIAALGILQINRMKERAANIKDFKRNMQSDSSVIFSYIIPQLARKLALQEIEPRKNLGKEFIEFLGLLGIRLSDSVPKIGFGHTRGVVNPPEFPLFDGKFNINKRTYGVIFLTPPCTAPSNLARVSTGKGMLRSGGADRNNTEKEIESLIVICIGKDVADWAVAQVNNSFEIGNMNYRNCVVVIKVHEEWPWILKILNRRGSEETSEIPLKDEDVRTQALLFENVSAHFWESTPKKGAIPTGWNQLRWIDVLKKVENYPSYITSEHSRPDGDMPTG